MPKLFVKSANTDRSKNKILLILLIYCFHVHIYSIKDWVSCFKHWNLWQNLCRKHVLTCGTEWHWLSYCSWSIFLNPIFFASLFSLWVLQERYKTHQSVFIVMLLRLLCVVIIELSDISSVVLILTNSLNFVPEHFNIINCWKRTELGGSCRAKLCYVFVAIIWSCKSSMQSQWICTNQD